MNTQAYSATNVVSSNIPSVVTTVFPAVGRLMISTLFILAGLALRPRRDYFAVGRARLRAA
jgi:putative oxidoreductase